MFISYISSCVNINIIISSNSINIIFLSLRDIIVVVLLSSLLLL